MDGLVRVKAVLARALGDESLATTIGDDADIVNELGLDSLQMISFLLAVEDEFDIELDFDGLDLGYLRSVRKFCEYARVA